MKKQRETFYLLPFIRILAGNCAELWKLWCLFAAALLVLSLMMFAVEVQATSSQIDGYFDSLYLTLITVTTVGFGDLHPVTWFGRIIAVLDGGLGIVLFGVLVWVTVQTLNNIEVIVLSNE